MHVRLDVGVGVGVGLHVDVRDVGAHPVAVSMSGGARRCVVIVPTAGHIEADCERGLLELERAGVTVWRRHTPAAIDLVRSEMASEALGAGFDELMWIDSDIGFSAADVERLRAHDAPFVCGLYAKRGVAELACHAKPGTKEIVFGEAGGLTEVLYVGFGFCLVRRQVWDDVAKTAELPTCSSPGGRAFYPYFMPQIVQRADGSSWYLAEDYAFCERARRAGHAVLADTRVRLHHIGRYGYTWEDAMGDRTRYANVKMILR